MCLLKSCFFAPTAPAAVYGPRCKTSLASLQYVKQCNSQHVWVYWHDKAVTMEPVLTFKSGVGERWIRVEESREQKNTTKQKSSFVTGGGPTLIYFPLLLTLLACLLPHEDTPYCVDGNLMATMQCMWVCLLLAVVFLHFHSKLHISSSVTSHKNLYSLNKVFWFQTMWNAVVID